MGRVPVCWSSRWLEKLRISSYIRLAREGRRVRFSWNPAKNVSNLHKHGIRFEVAVRVFSDPLAHWELDRHVDGEERWNRIGLIDATRLVVVAHTITEDENGNETVRIISARYVDRSERKLYEEG